MKKLEVELKLQDLEVVSSLIRSVNIYLSEVEGIERRSQGGADIELVDRIEAHDRFRDSVLDHFI
jgi:hypothetical protein